MCTDPKELLSPISGLDRPSPVDYDADRDISELQLAINSNQLSSVKALMTANPSLHSAPLGYRNNGPLTWVAECRVPWEPPGPDRLAMAQWMIDHGSDVHQGGDGPLMRAALMGYRIPMMELLVRNGANVNARWNGHFPIVFAPCETVEPLALQWLLDHGAAPNGDCSGDKNHVESALEYLIGTYVRSKNLSKCIDILVGAGCTSQKTVPAVSDILCGRLDRLKVHLDQDPEIVEARFPQLEFGSTAARRLTLRGASLLHVAAEYGDLAAAELLVERGSDVNAVASTDQSGIGGQTPLFHAVSQFRDWGLPVAKFLVAAGADLSIRVRLPGHYERLEEVVECTPLGYARLFPGEENMTLSFLLKVGAPD